MGRFPMLERYAAAAVRGDRLRAARVRGDVDEYEVWELQQSNARKAVGLISLMRKTFKTGRRDPSDWAAWAADLMDDGVPDWTYWLDQPGRRYRLRPWRAEDGRPWSLHTPCVTVLDGELCRALRGIPAGAFAILGEPDRLEDTDACCGRLFDISICAEKGA